MILRLESESLFTILDCTFAEKDPIKAAGFKFCSGRCEAKWKCGRCSDHRPGTLALAWWTPKPEIAARLVAYADEEARLALQPAQQRQALSRAHDTELAFPSPEGQVYRGFQKAGIAFVLDAWTRFKGALIADDMGLGKTVQALGLVNADPTIRRVLILCPKSLQLNWLRECDRWLLDKQESWKLYLAENSLPVPESANIAIVNYDKLVGRPGQVVAPSLVREKWDLVIFDEAHYLKNPKAERTRVALEGIPVAARRLLFLTGTPIENRPIEIHPILQACAPDEFPFWAFVKQFCDAREEWVARRKKVWKFDGHSNLELLNARLRGTVMVRRLKSEVLKELPPKVRQVVELPPPADVEDMLEEESRVFAGHEDAVMGAFATSTLAEAGDRPEGFANHVADLSAKVSAAFTELSAIRHELGLAKIEPALEWLCNTLDSVDKVIVWAWHHDVIDSLEEGLNAYLSGAKAETVRKMARARASRGSALAVPLRLRIGEGDRRSESPHRAKQGVHGVSPDEARSVADDDVSDVDAGSAASEEGRDSLHDHLEGHRDPEKVSPSGNSDLQREEERDEQPLAGSNRPVEGIRSGKRMGDQLESEHGEAQPHVGGIGKNRKGASIARVDGRVTLEERQEAVDRFQNDPRCRVFIGQTTAAGVGITLTAASTVAFVESDWVPGKLTQAEDRAHRIGQNDSVSVYHLVFDKSLDARMLQLVLEKQSVQDAALDSEVAVKLPEAGMTTGPVESGMTTEPVKIWPVATEEERAAAKAALRLLAERCDGAVKEDGAGFSKFDSRLGKTLAARPMPFTDGQVVIAKKLARKYQRQLPEGLKASLLGDGGAA